MAKWKKRKDLSTKHNPEIKIHQHAGNLDELMCSRRISNYCSSTSGTHRITRIAIPVIRHERRNKDFCVTTTNRTYLYRRTMRTYLYRRTMRTYLYRRTMRTFIQTAWAVYSSWAPGSISILDWDLTQFPCSFFPLLLFVFLSSIVLRSFFELRL